MDKRTPVLGALVLGAVVAAAPAALAQSAANMSFFVTSVGSGKGADLGGLAGADRHCQSLAQAAGAGARTWRAYLSADAAGGGPAVHAKDRIGAGPWQNVKGVVIAKSVADLHGDANNLTKQTAISEKGEPINGRGDTPNMHDILTGSNPDGTLAAGQTCANWTSSAAGNAIVGHHDRVGLRDDAPSKSWNSSHPSRSCSQDDLKATGGNGFFYCFAAQ
jgi:hypothetical protein